MLKSNIRFGTCSWKYESWRGIIYPEAGKFNYLTEYSEHFNTVEIDQWFWSLFPPGKVVLPRKETAKEYSNSVPDNFLFTIKVPNSLTLTHFYPNKKTDPLQKNPYFLSTDLFDEFLNSISPIIDKTGCLIFQFEYLNKQKMSSQNVFLEQLANFVSKVSLEVPIGIEIRNPNYLNEKYFRAIKQFNLWNVLLEGYFMPSIIDTFNKHQNYIDRSILRLHGPDRIKIEKISNRVWNKIYTDKTNNLKEITEIISYFNDREVDLFVNVNNHFEGSAPLTIQRIKRLLDKS